MAFAPARRRRAVTVEEHLERILDSVEPLPRLRAAAAGVPGPARLPSRSRHRWTCRRSTTPAWTATRSSTPTSPGPRASTPVQLPVVGESAAGQGNVLAMSPGTAVKIMTGAPVPSRRRPRRAGRVDRRRRRHRCGSPGRPSRGPAHPPPRRGRRRRGRPARGAATLLGPRQVGLLASVGMAQVALAAAAARGDHVDRRGAARARRPSCRHDTIYDSNSFMLAAAVRQAGAIAYRVGIVSDDPAEFADALSDQLVRADLVVTSGGVEQGRVRRRQGGAVADRHGVVRRGRDAAGQAAGLRPRGGGPAPRSSRCRATRCRPTSPTSCSSCRRSGG